MDVVGYITNMINQAVAERASDIHIEPQADCLLVRQRVDGLLIVKDQIPLKHAALILSRVKIMADLDIGEKRLPQDGTLLFSRLEGTLDIRIATLPTIHGEKVVLRLFHSRVDNISLNQLGMGANDHQKIKHMLQRTSGLLIITGPTGSGKTTTLYAMLQILNRPEMNVITLEDPIELQIAGLNQVAIQPKVGLTFARCLRSALRQDPDVIMIGEIRDRETADIAIGAALTGHLVLSTLHTNDAATAITRLLDMKMEPYRVAAALTGVVAQRLVRIVCKICRGKGCVHCQNTGYYQRTGVFETFSMDEQLERLIVESHSLNQLRGYLRKSGIVSLGQSVQEKMKQGLTSKEEYLRVISDVEVAKMEQ